MSLRTRSALRESRPALDRAVDLGFALLLSVCALRYFAFHALAGTGVVVLVLALGTGLSYVAAAVAAERAAAVGGPLSGQRIGLFLATLLWLPLAVIAPSFGWCAFALIFAMHRVLTPRIALAVSGLIVIAVSLGLWLMSKGQDLGLVLGPFFGGLVLSYAYATVTRTLDEKRAVIAELTETRSQLARSEREAGVLSERNRVASELHDTVVQRTASALLMIETAQHLGEGPAAQSTVSAAGEALRETLVETRRLVHGLADPQTRGATVTSALRAEAEAAGAEFVLSGHETLVAEETVHALQRITREALVNAAKHAGSTATRVTVTFFPESVGVDIADAGPGFDPDAVAQREGVGFGLRAMTWRAQNLGGTLSIESRPGGGTVIAASIPLDRADANNSTSTNTNTNTNTASATDREATGTGTQRAESETPS